MSGNSALLITITMTFAIFVATSPVHQPEGVAIRIHRRSNLTLQNGVFHHDKAILSTIRTANKYRQNLINLRNNLGEGALPEGAQNLTLIKIPDNLLYLLEKRQSEPLTDNIDEAWYGDVFIGTPGQKFLIDVDTISADLWVPSSLCMGSACSAKRKYEAGSSSTSNLDPGSFYVQYLDGSYASGPVYRETVTVGGVTVQGQYFSPVTRISDDLGHEVYDGILGLGFPAVSNLAEPFFTNAFWQGRVASKSFGLKLAISDSELYLGGANSKLYTGSIEFHKLSSLTPRFWMIGGASISVNGAKVVSGIETVIASRQTKIQGPPDAVKEFYSKIHGATLFDAANGFYSFPCNPVPNVSFSWGGKDWFISPSSFNLGETKPGSGLCVGAVGVAGVRSNIFGYNVWILGDSFLKNQYTVFDFGSNSVGFAQLR